MIGWETNNVLAKLNSRSHCPRPCRHYPAGHQVSLAPYNATVTFSRSDEVVETREEDPSQEPLAGPQPLATRELKYYTQQISSTTSSQELLALLELRTGELHPIHASAAFSRALHLPHQDPHRAEVLACVGQIVLRLQHHIKGYALSNVLYVCGKLGYNKAALVAALMERCRAVWHTFTAEGLVKVLWAVAKLRCQPDILWIRAYERWAGRLWSTWTSWHVSCTWWSLSHLTAEVDPQWMDNLVAITTKKLRHMPASMLSMTLLGMSRLRVKLDTPQQEGILSAVVQRRAEFRNPEWACALLAASVLCGEPTAGRQYLILQESLQRLPYLPPVGLCNLLLAVKRWRMRPSEDWMEEYLISMQAQFDVCLPIDFGRTCYNLGRLGYAPSAAWGAAFFYASSAYVPQMGSLDLANLLYGVSRLFMQPPNEYLESCWKRAGLVLHEANLRDVAWIMRSLAKLGRPLEAARVTSLLETKLSVLYSSSPRELTILLRAFYHAQLHLGDGERRSFMAAAYGKLLVYDAAALSTMVLTMNKLNWTPSDDWLGAACDRITTLSADFTAAQIVPLLFSMRKFRLTLPAECLRIWADTIGREGGALSDAEISSAVTSLLVVFSASTESSVLDMFLSKFEEAWRGLNKQRLLLVRKMLLRVAQEVPGSRVQESLQLVESLTKERECQGLMEMSEEVVDGSLEALANGSKGQSRAEVTAPIEMAMREEADKEEIGTRQASVSQHLVDSQKDQSQDEPESLLSDNVEQFLTMQPPAYPVMLQQEIHADGEGHCENMVVKSMQGGDEPDLLADGHDHNRPSTVEPRQAITGGEPRQATSGGEATVDRLAPGSTSTVPETPGPSCLEGHHGRLVSGESTRDLPFQAEDEVQTHPDTTLLPDLSQQLQASPSECSPSVEGLSNNPRASRLSSSPELSLGTKAESAGALGESLNDTFVGVPQPRLPADSPEGQPPPGKDLLMGATSPAKSDPLDAFMVREQVVPGGGDCEDTSGAVNLPGGGDCDDTSGAVNLPGGVLTLSPDSTRGRTVDGLTAGASPNLPALSEPGATITTGGLTTSNPQTPSGLSGNESYLQNDLAEEGEAAERFFSNVRRLIEESVARAKARRQSDGKNALREGRAEASSPVECDGVTGPPRMRAPRPVMNRPRRRTPRVS